MRVRSPACTTLMRRRSPSDTSRTARWMALPVSAKSSAIRGGLVTVKPAGGFAGGCLSMTRTITRPPAWGEMLTDSMLFVWANAGAHSATRASTNTP
jgi:hypothetical protein